MIRYYPRRLANKLVRKADPGENIFTRGDWTVCCVLDGCRVDTLAGELADTHAYTSVASSSKQWISRTFNEPRQQVAYVTGNPFSGRAEKFVGRLDQVPKQEVYGIETTPPEDVAAAAVQAYQDPLIDRVVVHFMQPHVPFRARPEWFRELEKWGSHRWKDIDNAIDRGQWFAAYTDNLRWVLEDGVYPLTEQIPGGVAVTSDHGNAAGEWGEYGHPNHSPVASVRKVPWVEINRNGTGIEPKPAGGFEKREQLKALGYR